MSNQSDKPAILFFHGGTTESVIEDMTAACAKAGFALCTPASEDNNGKKQSVDSILTSFGKKLRNCERSGRNVAAFIVQEYIPTDTLLPVLVGYSNGVPIEEDVVFEQGFRYDMGLAVGDVFDYYWLKNSHKRSPLGSSYENTPILHVSMLCAPVRECGHSPEFLSLFLERPDFQQSFAGWVNKLQRT